MCSMCCPLCKIYNIYFSILENKLLRCGQNISSWGLMCGTGSHWDCQLVRKKCLLTIKNMVLEKASESCRSEKTYNLQRQADKHTHKIQHTDSQRLIRLIKLGRQRSSKKPFLTCCVRGGSQQCDIKKDGPIP